MIIDRADAPILEYDPAREAVIEPRKLANFVSDTKRCVITYFYDVVVNMLAEGRLRQVTEMRSSVAPNIPVYEAECEGGKVCLASGQLGAAAAAMELDELIAMGIDKFVVCGGAGVLRGDIAVGRLMLPESAVRDEGASYHYLPPSREAHPHPRALAAIRARLEAEGLPYVAGKTWTTDGVFRETRARAEARAAEGCISVEMEASALFAVAQFRGVTLGQILYGGDDLSGEEWDSRGWMNRSDVRAGLTELSMRCCLDL